MYYAVYVEWMSKVALSWPESDLSKSGKVGILSAIRSESKEMEK